jgi:hypothetical protein
MGDVKIWEVARKKNTSECESAVVALTLKGHKKGVPAIGYVYVIIFYSHSHSYSTTTTTHVQP